MQRRIRFTRKVIDALPPSPADLGGKEIEYTSEEAPPGLRLVVTKRGLKSWLFRYVMPSPAGPGLKRAVKIGVYPGMEPADAIRVCLDLRARIAAGIDPQQSRQETVQEITLDTFFKEEYWVSAKLLRSAADVESRWRLHVSPAFGKLRFRDLKTADIVRFHEVKRVELCAATSNRLLALLKRVVNVAILHEHCERNPCRGVRMHPEDNIRNRTLAGDELRRFIQALAQEPSRVAADCFLFGLATGARRAECMEMTWSEVFVEEGLWRLPAARAKSKKARVIPLNDVALQVLASRAAAGKGVHVFEGKHGKPLSNPTRAWKRVLARAGIADLTPHDLRRSAATLLINQGGGNMTMASSLLGHAPGSSLTAQRYAFVGNDQLREAAQRLSSVLSAASSPAAS